MSLFLLISVYFLINYFDRKVSRLINHTENTLESEYCSSNKKNKET